jgi:hypothetical protein
MMQASILLPARGSRSGSLGCHALLVALGIALGSFGCSSAPAADGGSGSQTGAGSGNHAGSGSSNSGSNSGHGSGGSGNSPGSGATTGSTGGPAAGDGGPGSTADDGGGVGPGGEGGSPGGSGVWTPYHDPGTGAWEMVPTTDVASVCKLDLSKLMAAETATGYPWLIVRYGKICYATASAKSFTPAEAYSTTKTLGATVTGIAAYQSKKFTKSGAKTGPFTDMDRVDQWLAPGSFTYNKDALVAHVLGMVAHDTSLAAGQKTFAYDTVGSVEINSLGTMVNAVIAQDTANLTSNISTFTQKFLFTPLGMKNSTWTGAVYAYTWNTDLMDMARVGLLLLNWGKWGGQQLLDELWVYRMSHPSFEDANTGFGYLSWLNSSSNWESISGGKQQMAGTPGPCAPVCIHKKYPHGIASQSTDCNYMAPATCTQKYDVGVWNAEGLGGQLIQGHRGLDIVIVARNAQPGGAGPGTAKMVWDALQGAVIAGDPKYKGDMTSFCKDYGSNNYSPDWHEDPPEPE